MIPSQQSNHVLPFRFEQQEVRVIQDEGGDPWFVAKDVCQVLDVSNVTAAVEGLDEDEKGLGKAYTLGGPQDMVTISESGLYTLIIRSNKPQARPFRRWVTHEVLPAIRKAGAYTVPARASGWEVVADDWNGIGRNLSLGHRLQIADIAMRFTKLAPADQPRFMATFKALCQSAERSRFGSGKNAVALFVKECCIVGKGFMVHPPALYAHYLTWCASFGNGRPLGRNAFYRQIRETIPGIRYARPQEGKWSQSTILLFSGLGLAGDPQAPGQAAGADPSLAGGEA